MPSKIYGANETAVTFTDTAGDYVITLNNLGYGVGRVSARADKGAGSQANRFKVFLEVQWETAPVSGESVRVYISESDGTNESGTVGVADAAVADIDTLDNTHFVGAVRAEAASADVSYQAWFTTTIDLRYYSVIVWNASVGDNLQATNDISKVIVVPIPPETQ